MKASFVSFQVVSEADPSSITCVRNVVYALDIGGTLWRLSAQGWQRLAPPPEVKEQPLEPPLVNPNLVDVGMLP